MADRRASSRERDQCRPPLWPPPARKPATSERSGGSTALHYYKRWHLSWSHDVSETPGALNRAIAHSAAALSRVARWAEAETIDLADTGYADWVLLLYRPPDPDGSGGDLAARRAHLASLDAALRRVEAWSFDTLNDLTPAGYSDWAVLLDGPRERKTPMELLDTCREIDAHDGSQRHRARIAARH
jgi:hypothetical protein